MMKYILVIMFFLHGCAEPNNQNNRTASHSSDQNSASNQTVENKDVTDDGLDLASSKKAAKAKSNNEINAIILNLILD